MNNLTKAILTVMVTGLLSCGLVQADPIQGTISFTGGVTFDTGDINTANAIIAWSSTRVLADSGNFGSIVPNAAATFNNPWQFNPSLPVDSLWSVGGFSFDLASASIVLQGNGFLVISGVGIIHGIGFDDTVGTWSFTTQNPKGDGNVFSFSAGTPSVPDGGSAVVLLGVALTGVEVLRRKFARR